MKKMLLLGGGRWSRVLMSVLLGVLPADWQIVWHTRHGRNMAERWCQAHESAPIEIVEQLADAQLSQMDAAIVATSPHTHALWLERLLSARVPTLCEKPLVIEAEQADDLARRAIAGNCPLGVNLELHYASYLEQFAHVASELTSGRAPQQIELSWFDPWSEVRYGETKYSDVFTNIVDDMFPHCWSILRKATGVTDWEIVRVEYSADSEVQIALVHGEVSASVTLSRRAEQRTRRLRLAFSTSDLNLNDERDATFDLDFSSEPGFMVIGGERKTLAWQGDRPLTRSLQSFVDVVTSHATDRQAADPNTTWHSWPLSIVACGDAVHVSTAIASQLSCTQQKWLDRLQSNSASLADHLREQLLFDVFVPLAAKNGVRVEFTDPRQLAAFYLRSWEHVSSGKPLSDFAAT